MLFNNHFRLEGKHATLSASKHSWINYDSDKMADAYSRAMATQRGTTLHDFAAQAIKLRQTLPEDGSTMSLYVNDAIGYRMTPEQTLYYSDNAFGTADAVSFSQNKLRIHDLKTGESKTYMEQLEIYAAFFCLEYMYKPALIDIELRIYQLDEVRVYEPDRGGIINIMDKIVRFDKIINNLRSEEF